LLYKYFQTSIETLMLHTIKSKVVTSIKYLYLFIITCNYNPKLLGLYSFQLMGIDSIAYLDLWVCLCLSKQVQKFKIGQESVLNCDYTLKLCITCLIMCWKWMRWKLWVEIWITVRTWRLYFAPWKQNILVSRQKTGYKYYLWTIIYDEWKLLISFPKR
jgi:hypothetical protein